MGAPGVFDTSIRRYAALNLLRRGYFSEPRPATAPSPRPASPASSSTRTSSPVRFFLADGGVPRYFTMRFVEGDTLATLVDPHRVAENHRQGRSSRDSCRRLPQGVRRRRLRTQPRRRASRPQAHQRHGRGARPGLRRRLGHRAGARGSRRRGEHRGPAGRRLRDLRVHGTRAGLGRTPRSTRGRTSSPSAACSTSCSLDARPTRAPPPRSRRARAACARPTRSPRAPCCDRTSAASR